MDTGAGRPVHRGSEAFHQGLIEELYEFAKSEFGLDQPVDPKDPKSGTKREHLEAVAQQLGRLPDALANAPSLPAGGEFVWSVFNELHPCRSLGMAGPQPISFVELDAWQRVTGIRLRPFELQAIRAIDFAFLESVRG